MSSEQHLLEQRLREDPEDELAWQVYGDWLAQRGDLRGELIALEHACYGEPGAELEQRLAQLQAAVLADNADARASEARWRYGFIIELVEDTLEYPYEIEALAELLAKPQARLLSKLTLSFAPAEGEPLNELEGLEFFGAREHTVAKLASLDLRRIRCLTLAYSNAGDELAAALARIEMPELRELDLRYCGLSDAGLRALVTNHSPSELRVLHLQGNDIGAAGARALAGWPVLDQLERLDLRNNEIGTEGARALAEAPQLAALEVLHLRDRDLQREGCELLAASSTLNPDLRRLWRARGARLAR